MLEKHFVKFNDKIINVLNVDYFQLYEEKLKISLTINSKTIEFEFKDENGFNRFISYLKLFCNEFDSSIKLIGDGKDDKELLNG